MRVHLLPAAKVGAPLDAAQMLHMFPTLRAPRFPFCGARQPMYLKLYSKCRTPGREVSSHGQ